MLLRVAYDGTAYRGFARQVDQPTIQGELERALSQLYRTPIEVRGASRTDAGVHARGQIVAFEPTLPIPSRGVVSALGGLLSRDLAVWAAWEEPTPTDGPLHPRFCNGGKHYTYVIRTAATRDPFSQRFCWHLDRDLDVHAMHSAAQYLVGRRDFAAFRAADCQAATTVRRLLSVAVARQPATVTYPSDGQTCPQLAIDVHGEAFLKNMVRVIVGSLVDVGLHRRPPEWIGQLVEQRNRAIAGATAPASGLTLVEVKWPRLPAPPPEIATAED